MTLCYSAKPHLPSRSLTHVDTGLGLLHWGILRLGYEMPVSLDALQTPAPGFLHWVPGN